MLSNFLIFKKAIRNNHGMSLVEVMISASIGLGIFLFLNNAMIRMQKAQTRFERRGESEEIKLFLRRHLSDMRAYEEIPESDIPKRGNQTNFYYFPTPKSELVPLTYTEKEFQTLKQDFKCPGEMGGCRVLVFDYQSQVISKEQLKLISEKDNYILAIIKFVTPEDKISRSYLPELEVNLQDQNTDHEVKVLPRMFFVNQEGASALGSSTNTGDKDDKGKVTIVDPVSRANCYLKMVKEFPDQKELAKELCMKSRNSAPAECFIRMKKEFKVEDILAIVTCSQSVNNFPPDCFKLAQTEIGIGEDGHSLLCSGATGMGPIDCYKYLKSQNATNLPDMIDLKVCARALDQSPAECLVKLKTLDDESMRNALFLCPHHK